MEYSDTRRYFERVVVPIEVQVVVDATNLDEQVGLVGQRFVRVPIGHLNLDRFTFSRLYVFRAALHRVTLAYEPVARPLEKLHP